MKQNILYVMVAVLVGASANAQVNSGSNGSDGAFNPTTNTNINMADHPNGIYQYTSVNIPGGVTVTFIPNANNSPVTWLVQSNCNIDGLLDVSGKNANEGIGGAGGPGGGAGGSLSVSGQGPGGGGRSTSRDFIGIFNGAAYYSSYGGNASFGELGQTNGQLSQGFQGQLYGNNFLLPLLGGSGGGGSLDYGGGGGGGALLIAASQVITLNGVIRANGGNGFIGSYISTGGSGSGGAIRLLSQRFGGTGVIQVNAGTSNYDGNAGKGRIRLDLLENNFGGSIGGPSTIGFQPIIIPIAGQSVQLNIASVGGVAVSASPSGQFVTPDAILSGQQANPISIVVNCSNLPLNTLVTVTVKPANGSSISAVGYNNTGTLASSTATVLLNMPRGGGIIYATTATSN